MNENNELILKIEQAVGLEPIELKIKKLNENAVIPSYAHDGDVGMDLTAISVEYDSKLDMYAYHTGITIESDKHYGIFIFPRSSNRKTDAYLCNHVAVIDSAIYRGEIILCFKNRKPIDTICRDEEMKCLLEVLTQASKLDRNSIETAAKRIGEISENIYSNPMKFAPYQVGDRIAQMVVLPYPDVRLIETDKLTQTERGSNGFGSTGN